MAINEFKAQVVEKVSVLMTSAFGLVAALAWNEAIQNWFKSQTWLSVAGQWAYAIIITVIAVIATVLIGKISANLK